MSTAAYLFDLGPYTPRRRRPRGLSGMPPGVRAALLRLKRTIDTIPADEWETRRRRWEELQRSFRVR
jgi:hypothetical protein